MPSNVTLHLKGLLVLCAKPNRTNGKVLFPKAHPQGHGLTIIIQKFPPSGPLPKPIVLKRDETGDTIEDRLFLQIDNAAAPNITVRNSNAVQRKATPTNQDSIKWFVDLERAGEMYNSPIGGDVNSFAPILEFNSGSLFTVSLSEDFLKVQPGIFNPYDDFGTVAVELGIDFLSVTSAVFKNGVNNEVFNSTREPGTNYKIDMIHDAPTHGPIVTDANFYYSGVGQGIVPEKRILFMSIPTRQELAEQIAKAERQRDAELAALLRERLKQLGVPVGPEAACFPAYLGQTEL